MIYLMAIASLQAISLSFSSGANAQEAAQQAAQVEQMRSLEHLQVSLSQGGNVTIVNDGLMTSVASLLLVQATTGTRTVPLKDTIAAGAKVVVDAGQASSVVVVTSLGDVFPSQSSASQPGEGAKTLQAPIGGPGVDAQLYQNPSDSTRFFVAEGPTALAFSTQTGAEQWSFDAGQGEVTDVSPLADGTVYVSDGYYGDQFTSNLFRLGTSGASLETYSMRLLRLWTTVEVQFPNGGLPPWPFGSQPVQKGADSLYAFYDGWFLSSGGPSSTSVPSDSFNLASSDASQFYLYTTSANPGGFGCTDPRGNEISIYAYSATSHGVVNTWTTPVFLNVCNLYPNDLVASSAGSGLLVFLFSEVYWTQPNYYGGPYQGSNPFLAVLSSSSGNVLRSGSLDSNGYASVATDGTSIFLSIPSSDQVEVLNASASGAGAFYNVGMPATSLVFTDGSLFAISSSKVEVYSPSMTLEKTLDFSPDTLYSLSNSKQLEPQMVQPSFLVLNSTSYAALLRNSNGYGSLVIGHYSP